MAVTSGCGYTVSPSGPEKMGKSLDQQPGSTEWSHSYRMEARKPRLRARAGTLRERDKAPVSLLTGL